MISNFVMVSLSLYRSDPEPDERIHHITLACFKGAQEGVTRRLSLADFDFHVLYLQADKQEIYFPDYDVFQVVL